MRSSARLIPHELLTVTVQQMAKPAQALPTASPVNLLPAGDVYVTLTNTNASSRPIDKTDAANPRFYNDPKGSAQTAQTGNPNGHIVRFAENAGNAGTTFTWDVYLFGARSTAGADVNVSGLTACALRLPPCAPIWRRRFQVATSSPQPTALPGSCVQRAFAAYPRSQAPCGIPRPVDRAGQSGRPGLPRPPETVWHHQVRIHALQVQSRKRPAGRAEKRLLTAPRPRHPASRQSGGVNSNGLSDSVYKCCL